MLRKDPLGDRFVSHVAAPTRAQPASASATAGMPQDPRGIDTYANALAARAVAVAPKVSPADRDAAVEAGLLAEAQATADHRDEDAADLASRDMRVGENVAERTAHSADTVSRQHPRLDLPGPADWSRFGVVVPVLAASPGAGATVAATVLADVLQLAARSVLMVDTDDPARSGLNRAARTDGPQALGPHPAVRIRFSWRAQAVLARAETSLPVLAPGMLPPPRFWQPGNRVIDVTVVDVGHDPWRVTAHPLAGAGAWLRTGKPSPEPILVVRPTIPALVHAEQVLARLEPWVRLGTVTPPAQLIVVGAKRWPTGVPGTAGRRLQRLLPDAVFLPHDPEIALSGITAAVTPPKLRSAVGDLARRLRLLPESEPSPGKVSSRLRRGRRRGDNHDRHYVASDEDTSRASQF
ncbi:hypothetical protein [Amycolatopsis anabasis]|uniref:hypothetical protein n=1 Tax=Amycolatopsis anabasis TaxID=1840409 RepID=UPI0015D1C9E5|nr:hypothetical protein [Amycolatopsis anabasis]